MRIAICDDDPITRMMMRKSVMKVFDRYGAAQPLEIDDFEGGEAFLKRDQQQSYDAIFLDVDMPGMTGIDVAEKLAELGRDIYIIYVSCYDTYVYNTFKRSRPFDYIRKMCFEQELPETVAHLMQDRENKNEMYEFAFDRETYCILINDILYFEYGENHDVLIATSTRTYRQKGDLSTIEKALKKNYFRRCHKGFVVNVRKVRSIRGEDIQLKDGRKIPVGRKYKEEVIEDFEECKRLFLS